jgi:hypothetical protein
MSFNELTDAQIEVLTLLSEEAAEVVQDVAKILRHGLYSYDPTKPNGIDNLEHLCKELGDLEAAKELCSKYIRGFHKTLIENSKRSKLVSIDQWLHHASAEGLFTPPQPQPRPRAPGELTEEEKKRQRILFKLRGGGQ